MSMIGRNDPCPCGSGKKYKKCCSSKSDGSMEAILNRETVDIQSDIIRYAFAHTTFSHSVQESFRKFELQENMRDTFYFFVGIWALFTSNVINGKTAIEQFCSTRSQDLRPKLLEIVKSWIGKTPSIVRVMEVDGRQLVARNIFTDEVKKIKIIDEMTESPVQGALLTGYIVPFIEDWFIFFTSALSFEDDVADRIENIVIRQFSMNDAGYRKEEAPAFLQENFLELLNLFMSDKQLELVEQELGFEADSDQDGEVEELLTEKLQAEAAPKAVIDAGSSLWQHYFLKKQPTIKNEKIYAAALHYLLLDKLLPANRISQREAAELYDASVSSVSNRSREMAAVLEEELKEFSLE